jgi:type I restriction enzyme M protein
MVSMPSGVFKPYAGVSTAVLLFTRGAETKDIWFYDMAYDGFSLDDKRNPTSENDIPDILDCWRNRRNPEFAAAREKRLEEMRAQVAPLKEERLRLQGEINRLTLEQTIAPDDGQANGSLEAAKEELASLEDQIAPFQAQTDQLTRQFWVSKTEVKKNKYDLSASRYRQVKQDEIFYEKPEITMRRLQVLEHLLTQEMQELQESLN